MAFAPAAASGGSNPILGLFNAYNRGRICCVNQNSHASWTTTGGLSWHASDSNVATRVTWLDGLAQTFIKAVFNQDISASGGGGVIGINFDSTANNPNFVMQDNITGPLPISVSGFTAPLTGVHFAQPMESNLAGTTTFSGTSNGQVCNFILESDM